MDVEFTIRKQTEAARDLIADLRQDGADDDAELVADSIEGETGFNEAIAAALDEIDNCEALALGLKAKEAEFSGRRSGIEKRVERIRAAIERALVMIELAEPLRLPTATLSISRRKPGVVIEDEAAIPSRFFVQPDPPAPKLDKKALAEALAAGPVDGAKLDNGSISLTVRRR